MAYVAFGEAKRERFHVRRLEAGTRRLETSSAQIGNAGSRGELTWEYRRAGGIPVLAHNGRHYDGAVGPTRDVFGGLMDAVDPELVGIGHAALADIDGVRPVEELRQRWSGHQLLADVTVESVPPCRWTRPRWRIAPRTT